MGNNLIMNKWVLWLLVCLPVSVTYAQQNWRLSDCINYGLRNNAGMRVSENERLLAEAQNREALAAYLPSVNVTGGIDDNLKVQQSVIPAGLFGPEDIKVAFTKKFNTSTSVQLDQTIYDQSLLTSLKANRFNREKATLTKEQQEETLIYNISSAYYQIFVYREQLDLLEANDKTFRQQIAVMKLQVEKGVILQTDLDKVLVNFNNNTSQVRLAKSNIQLAENQLKNAMGYPIYQSIRIDSTIQQWHTETPSGDTAFSPAHLTGYRISLADISMFEIDEKRIRTGGLPKLTFYARYGGTGFGDDLNGSFKSINSFSAVGLKLNISLFGGFKRRAQYRQAGLKRMNAQENLLLDENQYKLDYENSRVKLLEAQVNVEHDRQNITLANSVFEHTDFQFRKGVVGLIDWLDAQNSLKEAQNNYLNSLYKFFQARIDLEKANGTLKTFTSSL